MSKYPKFERPNLTDNTIELNHLYYNINIIPSEEQISLPAVYEVSLDQTILDDPSKYKLCIPVFSIPPGNIPFIYFRIEEGLGQTNPNLGRYVVALEYNGASYPLNGQNLIFVPRSDLPVPLSPSQNGGVQYDSQYYNLYNIRAFISILNTAFAQCTTDLVAAVPALAPLNAPFALFDEGLGHINIVCDYKMITDSINILFNSSMLKFLDAIINEEYNIYPNTQYRIVPFVLPQFENSWKPHSVAVYSSPPAFIILEGDRYQTIQWGELKKFLITTSNIPVRTEATVSPNSSVNINEPVITDFTVTNWTGSGDNFVFYNQGVYRFADLISHDPLRKLSLSIYWQDTVGHLRLMDIYYDDSFSMKLGFIINDQVS